MRFAFLPMLGVMLACTRSSAPPPRDPDLCEEDSKRPKNDQVVVHVVSNDVETRIERQSIHDIERWQKVCKPPCDLHLFVDDEYRVAGNGIIPSTPFHLDGETEAADVEVRAARHSTRTTGTILLGIAAGSVATSTFAWAIYRSTGPADERADRATHALLVSFAVDFLLLVPGIALSAASTSVEVSPRGEKTSGVATSGVTIVPGGFVF
jgi:hypothetical protein